jgi:hypothetical protein
MDMVATKVLKKKKWFLFVIMTATGKRTEQPKKQENVFRRKQQTLLTS